IEHPAVLVLQATSPSGNGLIGIVLSVPKSFDGFRRSQNFKLPAKLGLWKTRSLLRRTQVERFDAAWIHGRGMNQELPRLQSAIVAVLGCGSLGSHVAVRLAQSGVGGLVLVDPDLLSA